MMIRLLPNSICLGLLTTLTGVLALLQPAQAAQKQTNSPVSTTLETGVPTTPTDDSELLAQATEDIPTDLLDLNTLPIEEDPGEAEGFIDGTIIRQVPNTLPPLVQNELGDELILEIFPTGDSFIPADGRSTLGLTGTILDASGQPVGEDVVVTLTTSGGTFIGAAYDIDR